VRALGFSSEFSFPSSHSQLAAAVGHWLVAASRHPQATSVTPATPAYVYVALVALSRVHVGVHYPTDVVVGALWGLLTASAYEKFLPVLFRLAPSSTAKLFGAVSVPGLLAAVAVARAYRRVCESSGTDPPDWAKLACRGKYKGHVLDPRNIPLGAYTGMLGVLAGLAIGVTFKGRCVPPPARASSCDQQSRHRHRHR
jgi:hypothetical protein